MGPCRFVSRSLSLPCLVSFVIVSLLPRDGAAQLAPTGGHYAGRASDTGYLPGQPSASGGYSTSVPLDLPAARGGVPIPMQIVYGTRGVGAAGVGWDIPLSYVRSDVSLAHRRPTSDHLSLPKAPGQLTMSLLGQQVDLVSSAGGTLVARQGTLALSVSARSDGTLVAYDGQGFTYVFYQPTELIGMGMWLLHTISNAGGNTVSLEYTITTPAVGTGTATGVQIDLGHVRYNTHPSTTCAKHDIALVYGPDPGGTLSLRVIGNGVLARTHTLSDVYVNGYASCAAAATTLRHYKLGYAADADLNQPRLVSVTMAGRTGTPEASVWLPVASYQYGSASHGGQLVYSHSQTIAVPTGADTSLIADVHVSQVNVPRGYGIPSGMWQSLTDFNGDGRPDFVLGRPTQLVFAPGQPATGGLSSFGAVTSSSGATVTGPVEKRWESALRFTDFVTDEEWRQAMDVNGDGRIDIIDAAEEAGSWVIYLNTPGATPSDITWVRRTWKLDDLYKAMTARGLAVKADYIPLSSRATGHDTKWNACDSWDGIRWVDTPSGFGNGCSGTASQIDGPVTETTFTEWDVRDVNGDGFVDVVFDSSPIAITPVDDTTPCVDIHKPCNVTRTKVLAPRDNYAPQGNHLDAMLNIAGMFIDTPTAAPFSAPITLTPSSCAVTMWQQSPALPPDHTGLHPVGNYQTQRCGLMDVNGDGIPDRVTDGVARLGTGTSFTDVALAIPVAIAQQSDHASACTASTSSTAYFVGGLRDVNGDGIPDAVDNNAGNWTVSFGTGAGFAAPAIPISSATAFSFSSEVEACNGSSSKTLSGFYDVDGDGKADMVQLSAGNLEVYQLSGGAAARVPEAGHLTSVDNGYGAVTSITYRSAKEDPLTRHSVPFAEVVVSQIDTKGTLALGGARATTRFAYGGAQLFYDPAHERWSFPGYTRAIELRILTASDKSAAEATLTDRYGLPVFQSTLTAAQRFGRYQRAGKVSDVTMLAGSIGTDPWLLLTVNIANDAHRTGGTHYDYDTKLFTEATTSTGWETLDLMYPYDFATSFGYNLGGSSFDATTAHGFTWRTVRYTWRGSAGPPSANSVEFRETVRDVDSFGNQLSVAHEGDLYRSDDDYCIDTKYAYGTTPSSPVGAPATRTVWNCDDKGAAPITYAVQRWEYDQLPTNKIAAGHATSRTAERHAGDTGALLGTIREFDAVYDAAGNLTKLTRTREDGVVQTTTTWYDTFGLAPTRVAVAGSSVPTLNTYATYDAVSLAPLTTTDVDGTVRGTTYDGFGRPLLTTIKLPGGNVGALSVASYLGFSGGDPLGRRVAVKTFGDAVATNVATTSVGRVATVYLDELGRKRMTQIALGADYGGETLVVGARTYDPIGRVVFEADSYPLSQSGATAYGTTRYFSPDRSLRAEIRGYGQQPLTTIPDVTNELFPTLYTHTFANHQEQMSAQDAASLTSGSPQNGVVTATLTSAIGRLLFRSTWRAGTRLEHAAFAEDRLGRLSAMIRYADPVNAGNPVQRSLRYDSFGQIIEIDDPLAAPQTRTFDNFGDLIETRFTPPQPEPVHSIVQRFDVFGRVTHHEEQNAGVTDAATVNDYDYDVARVASPQVQPTNVLGRLAHAVAPTSEAFFSYDGFGNVNAETFTDPNVSWYVEKRSFHGDGSAASIELDLPDNAYQAEHVDYGYDSAGRLRSMQFTDAATSETSLLYRATTVDPLGRVRAATFPSATLTAQYADVGRRLPQNVTIKSGSGSRAISFLHWDPVGRETMRTEDNGSVVANLSRAYDALGRIAQSVTTAGSSTTEAWTFAYDPLGNVTTLADQIGSADAALAYLPTDADRICRIGYGNGGLGGTACNVNHDSFGNVTNEPTRSGARKLAYFNGGALRQVSDSGGRTADFTYDAFGRAQGIDVHAGSDVQSDRNFGTLISSRYRMTPTGKASYVARKFPAGGFGVSRRGNKGPWIFEMNEARGTRFSFDDSGRFVQDVAYAPFGEARSTGAQPGAASYSSDQWNGGEAFDQLGLVRMGARFFDPVIGRFLSTDPLFVPRTAATTNPYAFANNDPINGRDPTGRDGGSGSSSGSDSGFCIGQQECSGPDGNGWGDSDGFDDYGDIWYLPPPDDGRHGPQSHATPPAVQPKPIDPFLYPLDPPQSSTLDTVLTDTGNLLTVGGTAESGVEKGYLVTAGYFGGQIAHDGAFLKGLGLFGKVVSIVGTAASVFILIKDAIAGNVTPSDVLNVGMGGTGIALAFVELPGWGLALGSAQLLLAWYDYTSELTAEMVAKLTPPINGIEWQVDELIRIVNENAAADYEQELRDYKDWSYGQSHACFVLGARDRDADADTLMRNAGDGIIVDGPP